MQFDPRRCSGIGLSDGETKERLWSYMRVFCLVILWGMTKNQIQSTYKRTHAPRQSPMAISKSTTRKKLHTVCESIFSTTITITTITFTAPTFYLSSGADWCCICTFIWHCKTTPWHKVHHQICFA